jgi:MoxR-like ATPase
VDQLRRATEEVYVAEVLERWIVALVRATREVEGVELGASVRGSLALDSTARAWALLNGREFVTSDDIEQLFLPVLGHRLLLTPQFLVETRELSRDEALARVRDECLRLAPRPSPDWDEAQPAVPRSVPHAARE